MFLKLGDKKYNLPDSVTIGRGEPFDINDRSLARSHAKIVFKKGQWKIKDLGTDTGITVNGTKIKSGKFIQITEKDSVKLGNVSLEIFEKLPAEECAGVRKISASNVTNYAPILYSILFISAATLTFLNSNGNYLNDGILLVCLGVALKVLGALLHMGRGYYFPFKIIHELLVSQEGVTLYLSDKTNFSVRFNSIKSWHVVGKCFFIKAYGQDLKFMMLEDHDEFIRILKNKCLLKLHRGQVLFSWLGILPIVASALAVTLLISTEFKPLILAGHFTGLVAVMGLLAYLFIEDLRELLPLPWKLSRAGQSSLIAGVIALTLVVQFNNYQGQRNQKTLWASVTECGFRNMGNCKITTPGRLPASVNPTK
ncbi:MAG: FHA domain-containing protein [Bdellovibrionota bacterium]